jgi:hypothetical protein
MEQEFTPEEAERRAREVARRMLNTPPQPRTKPKPDAKAAGGAAKPRKRGRVASAS